MIVVVAVVALAVGWSWWAHMKRRHGLGPLLWRIFSGAPLDGRVRQEQEPGRWHHVPRPRRAAIRGGSIVATVFVAVEFVRHRRGTLETGAVIAAVLAGLAAWWMYGKVRNWRHHRDWVNPLNLALPPGITVAELTRDRSRTVLALPAGFTGDDKDTKLIMQAARAKLNPGAELKGAWSLHGKNPQVTITLIEPPPGFVGFPAIQSHADLAEEHEIVLGLGRPDKQFPHGVPFIVSVDNDSPHLGISAGSGDGKSVTGRNTGCQLAHHGALIACLDAKLMSQHWAAGLPNVAYARTPAEIHALAIWLAAEVDRRNGFALRHADVEGKVHGSVGARIIGILEEMNITQAILTAYWKSIDGKGRSPAVLALDFVAFSGRAVHVNLLYIGQRLSAKATSGGSGDARENLGVLLMSNPAASTWKMLVGDRHALPPATSEVGRLQVVTAKEVTEVQGAYLTGAQARAYATSGVVAVPRSDMPCVGGLAPIGTPERAAQDVPDMNAIEGNTPDLRIVPDIPRPALPPPRITIVEAVAEGISGPSVEAVRKALRPDRQRPGVSPPLPVGTRGNADEYDRVEWCDWEEARRQPRRLVR